MKTPLACLLMFGIAALAHGADWPTQSSASFPDTPGALANIHATVVYDPSLIGEAVFPKDHEDPVYAKMRTTSLTWMNRVLGPPMDVQWYEDKPAGEVVASYLWARRVTGLKPDTATHLHALIIKTGNPDQPYAFGYLGPITDAHRQYHARVPQLGDSVPVKPMRGTDVEQVRKWSPNLPEGAFDQYYCGQSLVLACWNLTLQGPLR